MKSRSSKEIQAAYLSLSDSDRDSVIRDVLTNKLTQQQVFEKYLKSKSEDNRDMDAYYIARDAVKFISGDLTAEDLGITIKVDLDNEKYPDEAVGTITISIKEYNTILKRLDRIERRLGIKGVVNKQKRPSMENAPKDIICQAKACKVLGCGKSTIKHWADKGLVNAYCDGLHVFYSEYELMNSGIVKEYLRDKKHNKQF